MKRLLLYLTLFLSLIYADEHPPVFLPIESTEDFYSGSSIFLQVQATDESPIDEMLLYYRFSKEDSYTSTSMNKEIFYMAEIPESDVRPGRLEYYFFARDELGNQSTWPENGEISPESYPVFEPLFIGGSHEDISIELLNPIADKVSEEVSIIILSLYDPEELLDLSNLQLFVDDEDFSEIIFKSADMITLVPNKPLEPGKHIIEVKFIDSKGIYLTRKFNFTLAEIDLSVTEKIDFRKRLKFKGNISYNSDFNEFFGKDRPKGRPIDSHKLNISAKFKIGDVKIRSSVLMNTHLIDETARLALDNSQPSNRLKFGISSPLLDFKYGDFSTELSGFSLKGTRIRGYFSRLKLGPWRTSIVSGNTKELINFVNVKNYDPDYGVYSEGEDFTDSNGDNQWNLGEDFIDNPSTVDGIPVVGMDSLSHINHTKGTAVRKMHAFRTELNFEKFNFGINGLKSYDDIEQYALGYEQLYDQYTFLGNAVISTDFTLRLNNKKTQFKGETAISLMNDLRGTPIDTLAEKMDMSEDELKSTKDLFNYIEDLVGFNINSDLIIGSSEGRGISIPLPDMDSLNTNADVLDYMINNMFKQGTYKFIFKTPIEFEQNTFDFQAEYRRVPANFISLGNSSIQTDIQGLKTSIKGRLFKNIVSINMGYDNSHDNLMGETADEKLKSSTSTSVTKSGALGINYLNYPSINYSVRVMDRNGQSIKGNGIWDDGEELDDLNEDGIWNEEEKFTDIKPIITSNKTITHTISPSFKFKTENDMNVSLGGNIMVMNYNDNLYDSGVTATNANFTTGSYTGSLGLRFDSPLSFNMGAGLSINSPENINLQPTQFLVITSKLGYKFMGKTLSTFLGINVVSGSKKVDALGEGGINNSKITMKTGAQYKFANNMSVGLNIDFISLSDNATPENSFSEFKGKLKFKMGF